MKITRLLQLLPLFAAATFAAGQQTQHLPNSFLRGGDVSEIPEVEAKGGVFSYHGKAEDPFAIMKEAGWNFVRFRIWNSPTAGYCDKAHTLEMAKRAAKQGLKISLDFHYSDWWADPGKQYEPAAWKGLSFDNLKKALYDYTKDVVSSMVAQGTPPIMVQVGNEITSGMVWPEGKLQSNNPEPWQRLGQLLTAGFQAVHDAAGRHHIITMIHLDRGGDNKGATWWFDHIKEQNVQFDAIGLSYYPIWHGNLEGMKANLTDLATRYRKDIYVVETAYPWRQAAREGGSFDGRHGLLDGLPPTPEGQAAFLKQVIDILQGLPGHRGKGLLYWAPTWIAPHNTPSTYGNLATFGQDGDALPAVDVLGGNW